MTDQAGAETNARAFYPSIKRRLICMLYEALLLGAVLFFAGLAFLGISGGDAEGWQRHAFQAYLFLVIGLYFSVSWRRGGQTLPMQTWHLRLVGADGSAITTRQALARYVCAWPSVCLGGIGILYAVFDRERQFLHDRLAGTRIVNC